MPEAIAQIVIALAVPVVVLWLEPYAKPVRTLSPVVVCYLVGMAFGNQGLVVFSNDLALGICNVTVALAIPLLLFSVDLSAWLKLARNTVVSFSLTIVAVAVSGAFAHLLFADLLAETPSMAGMLAGVYTGGTPNMAAVGTALEVRPEIFILLNAADMVASFAYLMFLLVLAVRIPPRFLPPTPRNDTNEVVAEESTTGPKRSIAVPKIGHIVPGVVLAVAIVAVSMALSRLVGRAVRDTVVVLVITTLSVLAAIHARVRSWTTTHDAGQFLLLVFCVAMGFTTDFSKLFSSSPMILLFTATVLFGAVAIHFLAAILLRIDRDTVIVTSAAAIFGPHMVGPVCLAIRNQEVLFSGIASGLVGYAVGNYLGIGLAWMLG